MFKRYKISYTKGGKYYLYENLNYVWWPIPDWCYIWRYDTLLEAQERCQRLEQERLNKNEMKVWYY